MVYRGDRRFLSSEPIADGGPHIAIRFSKPDRGTPMMLFATLNFDDGDPVQPFIRVSSTPRTHAP
jgi:hypothetical protein